MSQPKFKLRKVLKALTRRGPLRVVKRLWIAMLAIGPKIRLAVRWSFSKTEDSNFYYQLEPQSELNLAHSLATTFGVSRSQVQLYFSELKTNINLMDAQTALRKADFSMRHSSLEPGRRLAWYAVARILKPKVILETGVHQGVGAFALCMALEQNYVETGILGKYFGTDLRADAGALVRSSKIDRFFNLLVGDSIDSIENLDAEIDLYVSDSDHLEGYERKELLIVESKLSPESVVISDNSHSTSVLSDWSEQVGREFTFFRGTAFQSLVSRCGCRHFPV